MEVRILNKYNVAENSGLYRMFQEHLELMKKHLIGPYEPNLRTLREDMRGFYLRWMGEKSHFVRNMTDILYKSTLTMMAKSCWEGTVDYETFSVSPTANSYHVEELNKLPGIYDRTWKFLVKYVNGDENSIMNDAFFDNCFAEYDSRDDIKDLGFLETELMCCAINLIEEHWEQEKKSSKSA